MIRKSLSGIFVMLFALMGFYYAEAAEPTPATPKKIVRPIVKLQLSPASVELKKLQPITKFRTFSIADFRHPQTGAALTHDSRITIMKLDANGKRVPKTDKNGNPVIISGKEYETQINDLERKINAYGYSLHDKRTAPLVLQKSKVNTQKFQMQKNELRTMMTANKAPVKPAVMALIQKHDFSSMRQMHDTRVKMLAMKVKPIHPGLAVQSQAPTKLPDDFKPVHLSDHWDKDLGDHDYFQASIHANMDLSIAKELAKASAAATAKVMVFSYPKDKADILSINASVQAPPKGSSAQTKLHFDMKVLGEDLFTPIDKSPKPGEDSFEAVGEQHQDYPVDYNVPFMIGPIPVDLDFGYKATVGVKYAIYVHPLWVDAKITPSIHTDAHASCKADLVIASAGVKIKLVLLNDDLEFGATTGLGTDKPHPYWRAVYYGHQKLTALSGNLTAFAAVDLLLWSDEWDWKIFDWEGFEYDAFIIDPSTSPGDTDLITGEVTKANIADNFNQKSKVDHNDHPYEQQISHHADEKTNTETWTINSPNVSVKSSAPAFTEGSGTKHITFQPGDEIDLEAGGCVQTGGSGATWKRYVNPTGPNANRLYFATIDIPGLTSGMQAIRTLGCNSPDKKHPDVCKHHFSSRVKEPGSLKIGYEDDNYKDNGYWEHDAGTENQCKDVGNAYLKLKITHHPAGKP